MRIFTRCETSPWPGRGEWVGSVVEQKRTARVGCPNCGVIGTLNHEIDDEGRVTPSVGCPEDCGYHETGVILEGWSMDK